MASTFVNKDMRSVVLVLLTAFTFARPLHAQSRLEPECPPARDSLYTGIDSRLASGLLGEVTDRDTGRPIRGASITLDPGNHSAGTDSLGAFRIVPVAVGRYHVRIGAIGFAGYSDTVTIRSTAGTRLHVPLVPQYAERCRTVRRVPER